MAVCQSQAWAYDKQISQLISSLLFIFFLLGKNDEQLLEYLNKVEEQVHGVPVSKV